MVTVTHRLCYSGTEFDELERHRTGTDEGGRETCEKEEPKTLGEDQKVERQLPMTKSLKFKKKVDGEFSTSRRPKRDWERDGRGRCKREPSEP